MIPSCFVGMHRTGGGIIGGSCSKRECIAVHLPGDKLLLVGVGELARETGELHHRLQVGVEDGFDFVSRA